MQPPQTDSWWALVVAKFERWLGRRGHELARRLPDDPAGFDGRRNVLPRKLTERLARAEGEGWFEPPEETALQYTAAHFIGDAKRILCIGPGVAALERFVSVDTSLEVVGVLPDPEHQAWCSRERAASNVSYVVDDLDRVRQDHGPFDLVLAVEAVDAVIEFPPLLEQLASLADRAVITACNRARDFDALTSHRPRDPRRVREWTAGEFYWTLRGFYPRVDLFGMDDPTVPSCVRVGLHGVQSPLLAICQK